MKNIQSYIELFHLLFLRQLEGKLDKKLYALKGGCNLRFYFKSIRYSEDIDFDIAIIAKSTLQNKIKKILESTTFERILQNKGLKIIQYSETKQTETTQRWKVMISHQDSTLPIPTKIEFSRRQMDKGTIFEAIDSDVINQYNLYPVICNHYDRDTAFLQKINALINRTETQARDIFDLKWLLDQKAKMDFTAFTKEQIEVAIENIKSMHYADFKSQVIAYLLDEYKDFYDSAEKWHEICMKVVAGLRGKAHETD